MNVTYEHKRTMTLIGFSTHIRPDEGYEKCPEFWDREYEGRAYEGNGSAMLEVYSAGDMRSPDYECGIWVPVRRKPGQSEQEAAETVATMLVNGIL